MFGKRSEHPAHDDLVRAAATVIESNGPIAVDRERLARELQVAPQDVSADIAGITAEAYRGLSAAEIAHV